MYGYYTERDYEGDCPYTDLATERRRVDTDIPGIEYKREVMMLGSVERIKITSKEGEKSIGRPIGIYNTLELGRMDLLDPDSMQDASDTVAKELEYIVHKSKVVPKRLLVVGLGNPTLTPDAIGCETAKEVRATMHIKEMDNSFFEALDSSEIAVCTPGVASVSGMDASVTVKGICNSIKPDAVIVIDALASRSPERLGSTIQICNTGIYPGSGLGNPRVPLNKETLGTEVIAIGVPTIIDSRVFANDKNMKKHTPMFVSPKEINEIVFSSAKIIGGGINKAFGIYS